MFKNIKSRIEFMRRIEILWADDFEELELEEFPTTESGGFAPWRVGDFLRLARLHPEYHMVTCIGPGLYINAFVPNGLTYHLASGDPDPLLVHDPFSKIDTYLLQSLNSGRKRLIA